MLLYLISRDLTQLAADHLGQGSTGNRDIQVLLLIHRQPGLAPTVLADRTGMVRSALSRTLRHLQDDRLVRREQDPSDGRSFLVFPTAQADERVQAFEWALADFFDRTAITIQEVVELLAPVAPDAPASPIYEPDSRPLELVDQLVGVGAGFVEEVMPVASRYGLQRAVDRAALSIICVRRHFRPVDLAGLLHLTSGGATVVLDRLAAAGLIGRRRPVDARDRRAVLVVCTPRGEDAVAAIAGVLGRNAEPILGALQHCLDSASAAPGTSSSAPARPR